MRLATKRYKQINSGWKEISFSITDATTIATDTKTVAGNYSLSFIPNTSTATVHFGANSKVALHTIQINYHHIDTLITQPRKGGYRYGFNNMERDDEAKGQGNSYTTEFRQYDPRLGRWLSLDPLMAKFPWQSPYVGFDNNPIIIVDPKGLAGENVNNGGKDKNKAGKEPDANELPELVVTAKRKIVDKAISFFKAVASPFVKTYESFSKKRERKDNSYKPNLEIKLHAGSAGVGVGAFGGEVDVVGWNYLRLMPGDGWWESHHDLKINEFSFVDAGAGTSIKPGISAEVLSIGGGTLTIDENYWNNNPERSLKNLLSNKRVQVIYGGAGYKHTSINIFDSENVLVASGTIHSFALGVGAGVRQGTYNLELSRPMTEEDSIKVATENDTPYFNRYLKTKGQ